MQHHNIARRLAAGLAALAIVLAGSLHAAAPADWWNNAWQGRKALTIDTAAAEITEPVGDAVVLVRLHQGNFPFEMAASDGSDIRFVSAAGEPLPFFIEKFDSLLYEAYVWVRVPEIGADTSFWVYYGNPAPTGEEPGHNPAATHEGGAVLAYNFAERNTPPQDATGTGNNATSAGTISEGALIGSGMRLLGADLVEIPPSDSLTWAPGQAFTLSAWLRPSSSVANAVFFSRVDGANALRVGLNNLVPYVEITSGGSTQRTAAGDPIAENFWKKLSVVSDGSSTTLFVDGAEYATLNAAVPALTTPIFLGGDSPAAGTGNGRFVGELDEMRIEPTALPAAAIAFAAMNQSASEVSQRLLTAGEPEFSAGGGAHGHNETLEHVMLFGDIANNMMFDGWIAVGVCILMIIFGWSVAVKKYLLLGSLSKGTDEFLKHWKNVKGDLTVLDHEDDEHVQNFGGKADAKSLRLMRQSPLYHVYHIGAEEIRHRMEKGKNKSKGLSARSIQAIKAALETGLVRENQRLNKGIVLLTISIAGGPYVGLLGTVVGVMITFALIAKTGEVEVNSIAPGIASALLATVAGLVVAIPALFMYSYLNGRIRDLISEMQVFIDEFIAKIAEFYPAPSETLPVPTVKLTGNDPSANEPATTVPTEASK